MFSRAPVTRQSNRSLRELVRGAVATALEFATLGEVRLADDRTRPGGWATTPAGARVGSRPGTARHDARLSAASAAAAGPRRSVTSPAAAVTADRRTPVHVVADPHRRMTPSSRARRPGSSRPTAQVCRTPR